ncbi:hypothetical protein NUM3379_24120 [Kineococcus sp. NUM-3379]
MDLPSVVHDAPAVVLLVDTRTDEVVHVDDRARRLAPGARLPLDVEAWSSAAGLRVVPGRAARGAPGTGTPTLARLAAGDPTTGHQVGAVLRPVDDGDQRAWWAIGTPLQAAPEALRDRSLVVLMPIRSPDADGEGAADRHLDRSVLAGSVAMTVSDPTAADNPLIWVSPSFEHVTGYTPAQALGRNCRFLQGSDTDPATVARLRAGIAAGETVSVVLLNYRQDGSAFHNHLIVSPVFDAGGHLTHHVSVQSDVTQQVLTAHERDQARVAGGRARAAHAAAERAHAAAESAHRYARLVLTLSEALATAITVEDVARTVTDVVAAQLGAAGGGLTLADPARTRLDFVSMEAMPPGTDAAWARIDWQEDAPLALSVRTRRAIFHRDHDALTAGYPAITGHAAVPATGATVYLPLIAADEVIGAVFLYWDQVQDLSTAQRDVLEALGRYTAQAVQRASLFAQRRTAAQVLQQSLLTHLPEPDHLELRARYVPAAVGEHVGGDWYDAVVLPDGSTVLVIGDVTGHDIVAAARMGQLRGLLRAYAFDRMEPPAEVVARLDRALVGLRQDGLATLVLARIEQSGEDRQQGVRRLRWTNAGHPPPILLHADGTTELLESDPELLVGLVPDAPRSDHRYVLPPDSTLLMYTDGLIEHRGRSISDGIADLRRVLSACFGRTLQELLDHLVAELVGRSPDDDCAVLAVRAHREDRPRPREADLT